MLNFEGTAWNLRAWLKTGEELELSADVIWEKMNVRDVFDFFAVSTGK